MPRLPKILAALLGLLAFLACGSPAAVDATEEQLKVAFLHKFIQFTAWPQLPTDDFRICMLGEDSLHGNLNYLTNKRIFQLPVTVHYLVPADSVASCQVVYLNPPNRGALQRWRRFLANQPILTVSDDADAWDENVIIVFALEPNGIRFKANLTAARAAGLFLRSQMLELAREVR